MDNGNWEVLADPEDGRFLRVEANPDIYGGEAHGQFGSQNWQNYKLVFRARIVENELLNTPILVFFRTDGIQNDCFTYMTGFGAGGVNFWREGRQGTACVESKGFDTEEFQFTHGEWYEFQIIVFNNQIILMINNEIVSNAFDDNPADYGNITLGVTYEAGFSTIDYDDIEVIELLPGE